MTGEQDTKKQKAASKDLPILSWTSAVIVPVVLLYPLVVGLLVYLIFRAWLVALIASFVALALLPCYLLSNIWRRPDPETEDKFLLGDLDKKELIDIWKKCVDVQMHFNTIELQIRNYAVTLLVTVIGAAAYALKEHMNATLFQHTFSIALAILPAGILGWLAFYFMDRHWYHRLLLGSVKHAAKIEQALGPALALGKAISKESPIHILGVEIHSTEKIDLFYAAGLIFLIALTGFLLLQAASSDSLPSPYLYHETIVWIL